MQENNPQVLVASPVEIKKSFPVLMLVLVLLLIASLVGTGYLGYQNTQLQKQITGLKSVAYVTPSPVATADSTAGWKTYTDPKGNFTFKYPSDWISSTVGGALTLTYLENNKEYSMSLPLGGRGGPNADSIEN